MPQNRLMGLVPLLLVATASRAAPAPSAPPATPPAPVAATAPPSIASWLAASAPKSADPAAQMGPAAPVAGPGPLHRPRRQRRLHTGVSALNAANAAALAGPRSNAFVNANLIYDYELGRLYRIDASPRFLTTVVLRRGEHLVSKAAGDTVRWVLGETVQGSGDTAQTLVLIKPARGGLRTNLVLTTDERSYFLEAVSHDDPVYTSQLSWSYPAEEVRETAAARAAMEKPPMVQAAVAVEALHFGYRIDHPGQRKPPPWTPERVFDDGVKTYIALPAASPAAPPLFIVGDGGRAELVNYRLRDGYYVVDRLFDMAELRLGEAPQSIVRITREGRAP